MTQFHQPSSGSLAVNRVVGKIVILHKFWDLLKPMVASWCLIVTVFLFGANSRVDVGGIVASTGDVSTKKRLCAVTTHWF